VANLGHRAPCWLPANTFQPRCTSSKRGDVIEAPPLGAPDRAPRALVLLGTPDGAGAEQRGKRTVAAVLQRGATGAITADGFLGAVGARGRAHDDQDGTSFATATPRR
jgi:hypothetical protein